MKHAVFAFAVLLSYVITPSRYAIASGALAPSSAGSFLKHGVELRKARKNGEALVEFLRAYALDPTPIARAQVALAEQALGRWVDAERDLTASLEATNNAWISANRPILDEAMATITDHLGWLDVDVNVGEAAIVLDGKPLERGPKRVPSGASVLQVRAPAYEAEIRRIDIASGARPTRVVIELVPLPSAPRQDAPISRDANIVLAPPNRTAPFALGAIGIAGIGLGTYFGIRTFNEKGERSAHCSSIGCDSFGLRADGDARTSATISTTSYALGTASLAAAVVWLLLSRAERWTQATFAPTFDLHGAGVSLRGHL